MSQAMEIVSGIFQSTQMAPNIISTKNIITIIAFVVSVVKFTIFFFIVAVSVVVVVVFIVVFECVV